jgi:hypothetical protein
MHELPKWISSRVSTIKVAGVWVSILYIAKNWPAQSSYGVSFCRISAKIGQLFDIVPIVPHDSI